MKNEDVSKVLNDVQDMKGRQDEMTMKLDQIKRFETFQLFGRERERERERQRHVCLFGVLYNKYTSTLTKKLKIRNNKNTRD